MGAFSGSPEAAFCSEILKAYTGREIPALPSILTSQGPEAAVKQQPPFLTEWLSGVSP